jgi:hypothetical protein
MMHSEPALGYELRCSTYAAHGRFSWPLNLSKQRNGLDLYWTPHPQAQAPQTYARPDGG